MSRYDEAKLPSLKDKIREQAKKEEKVEKKDEEVKKGRRLNK